MSHISSGTRANCCNSTWSVQMVCHRERERCSSESVSTVGMHSPIECAPRRRQASHDQVRLAAYQAPLYLPHAQRAHSAPQRHGLSDLVFRTHSSNHTDVEWPVEKVKRIGLVFMYQVLGPEIARVARTSRARGSG